MASHEVKGYAYYRVSGGQGVGKKEQKGEKGNKKEEEGTKMKKNHQNAVGRNILTKPQRLS